MNKPMVGYIVFAGEGYEARGGWYDFLCGGRDLNDAFDCGVEYLKKHGHRHWFHVVKMPVHSTFFQPQGEIVADGERRDDDLILWKQREDRWTVSL